MNDNANASMNKGKGSHASKTLQVEMSEDKPRERMVAEIGLGSILGNSSTAMDFAKGIVGDMAVTDTVNVMKDKVRKAQSGDLSDVEGMLMAQAVALDTIFTAMAKRSAMNSGQYMNAAETYMRMALKAQSQCRATLETLAEIKYPKHPTFVGQQNVAYQQQVNNGCSTHDSATSTHAHAHGKNQFDQNKLLVERTDGLLHSQGGKGVGRVKSLEPERLDTACSPTRKKYPLF